MLRAAGPVFAAVFLMPGCSRDPYLEVVDKQVANFNEMADILAKIRDPESMGAGERELARQAQKFQQVERDRRLVPQPDAATLQRLSAEQPRLQKALGRVQHDVRRIKSLPGGPEFFSRVGNVMQASQNEVPR